MDEEDLTGVLKCCLHGGARSQWDLFFRLAQPVVAAGVKRTLARGSSEGLHLTDDMIQETFLKLCADDFRVLRSFRADDEAALRVYLKTVAATTVLDHFRSQTTLKQGSGKVLRAIDEDALRVGSRDKAFEQVERENLIDRVTECLKTCDDRGRRMFWLYHRQGLTPRTIAALPGIAMTPGAVETAIYRLTGSVRECLRRAGALAIPGFREGKRA